MIGAHLSEPVKHAADAAAVLTPIAVFLDVLPHISALLAAIWLTLRIAIALQEYRLNGRKLRGDQ